MQDVLELVDRHVCGRVSMTYGFKSRHPHQMEKNRDFFREDLGFFFRFGYFYLLYKEE